MDKRELKDRIMNINTVETGGKDAFTMAIPLEGVIDLIDQLDEPEKVAVPRFVAEWIETEFSEHEFNYEQEYVVWESFRMLFLYPEDMSKEMHKFLTCKSDVFVDAVRKGYIVEEVNE